MTARISAGQRQSSPPQNDLLTPASLALSLAPPRAPPHQTPHRSLLAGHPHLPAGPNLADRMTRRLGSTLSLKTQNGLRDGGGFRRIADGLVSASVPAMAVANPAAMRAFLTLRRQRQTIQYGPHPMQKIDLFLPRQEVLRGVLYFVHGGAWGSGMPWMYHLVAPPFLALGLAVAVVGYRTYPDADVPAQVEDLERASVALRRERPFLFDRRGGTSQGEQGVILMGHSSGAHIALLMLVNRIRSELAGTKPLLGIAFTSFIGLSGPYDIGHHFDYEAGRGVEELSPLKAACGLTRHSFRLNSPASRLMATLVDMKETETACIGRYFPPTLLVHGIEDSTVPFTATSEAARIIRSCGVSDCFEAYLGGTGHQETATEIMLGGGTRDAVLEWVKGGPDRKAPPSTTFRKSNL